MSRDGAVALASEAIKAGIFNDLGSGSNVDVAVITREKTTLLRNYIKPNERETKMRNYRYAKGTTAVLKEKVIRKEDISRYVSVHELSQGGGGGGGGEERMDVDT